MMRTQVFNPGRALFAAEPTDYSTYCPPFPTPDTGAHEADDP